MNFGKELEDLLKNTAKEFGKDLNVEFKDLRAYTAARTLHLASIIDQPGFLLAVKAERDNVLLKFALAAVDSADAFDQRVMGIVTGVLSIGARALAGG